MESRDGPCGPESKKGPGANGSERVNSYALVTYIPHPLGKFLDDLRCELVPLCTPRAHVTILPPRPLSVSAAEAWDEIRARIGDTQPFEIEARHVNVFDASSVVYIELDERGRRELERLHDILDTGILAYQDKFAYHPHVTLAQEFGPVPVKAIREKAEWLWNEYAGERRFPVETVTFVQNTQGNRWQDLAQLTLGAVHTVR